MVEPPRDPSRHSLLREVVASVGVGLALAVAMSWPLLLRLGSRVPHDDGDPLLELWQIAWIGHAWIDQPLHLFQANTFWPLDDTLAFTDALIGYTPAGVFAQHSPGAAVVAYNVLFLFAYTLAYCGAYALARVLGLGGPAAIVTGAAFAYAPWRLAQDGHLHVLSSGGVPLALALLVHGYRRGSARSVVAGWLVAAWQVTLGFTLGLPLVTLLAALGLIALSTTMRPPRRLDRRLLVATAAGVGVVCLVAIMQARPYLRVAADHPEAARSLVDVFRFSPPVSGFLAAPDQSLIWGGLTSRARDSLPFPDEQTLFPGLVVSLLAMLGVVAGALPKRLRVGLAAGVVTCAVLSLGVRSTGLGYLGPYRLLYELPGWDGIRAPGRLNTLTSLGLAVLAGAGAATALRAAHRRVAWTGAGSLAAAVIALAIVVEGRGPLDLPAVPEIPAAQSRAPAPILYLPSDDVHDLRSTYWSTAGFPAIANGSAGFDPVALKRLRDAVTGFPDRASVAALRAYGIRSVILSPGLAAGTPWSDAAGRPIDGLPLTRERVDDAVIYRLEPFAG